MKTFLLFILILFAFSSKTFSQDIEWVSFGDLSTKLRKEKRPILIFIYTDWCKFCKMQEKNTFKNPEIVSMLSQQY
ncbi:MAG: thioredoxin family protein, partial [Bacteroidota bacterium]